MTERVDSAGDLQEEKLSSIGSLLFEDTDEDEPDDPRVQEEVCSRHDGIPNSTKILRGAKDLVHMKTAKMMQDFNSFCNLDVNHNLLLIYIIKVVYLCTLHNKIISPAHFVVYMLWRPTPTWFSNKHA